jgi:hypothetical protein
VVDLARLPPGQRGAAGKLRLVTNDRTEGERDVPLLALGKLGAADPGPTGAAGRRAE